MSIPRKYTDEELIQGCLNNDRYSQEMLFRKYFPTMMQMCLRYTNDRDKAMEIVNNGFLRVYTKLHTYAFKGSFEGWIRKLVYHSLSDYFKQNSRYLQFLVFEDYESIQRPEALSRVYTEDIMKLVALLPPATQQVFRMYAIEGYTHVEIAKQIDISIGTSKWHLSAARKKLKELIQQSNNLPLYAG
ncbi:MAG: RNA polymerase sigma factor [Bacteroidota bacterium]